MKFNDEFYNQSSTAMGTIFARIYATLLIGYFEIASALFPVNILASEKGCFKVVGQHWNNVDLTLKMKENLTSDFQRCTMLIQRQCKTIKLYCYKAILNSIRLVMIMDLLID